MSLVKKVTLQKSRKCDKCEKENSIGTIMIKDRTERKKSDNKLPIQYFDIECYAGNK